MLGCQLIDFSRSLQLLFFMVFIASGFSISARAGILDAATSMSDDVVSSSSVGLETSGISNAVLNGETLAYRTSYSTVDWSGELNAFKVTSNGALGSQAWSAGVKLDAMVPAGRVILTARFNADGSFSRGVEFRVPGDLDMAAQAFLMTPASIDSEYDTVQSRIDWLRGDKGAEASGTMRRRNTLLGAIVRSQALYLSYPAAGYRNVWPTLADGGVAPETKSSVSYGQFSENHSSRTPVVYVGANDGMLHAFDASQNVDGSNTPASGSELWAYMPRSAYTNIGNLTRPTHFVFSPTVDATPVTGDVFFDRATIVPAKTSKGWHTILVGGLGGGGRGIYALDVTDPDPADIHGVNVANVESKVLWEFNADMPMVGSVSKESGGSDSGDPADLGYTYAQPNIARLANGKWVVLVPSGYFPGCRKSDKPTDCTEISAASKGYSALFVLDAQTGALICELKTPTTVAGVTSRGLSSVVLGDYNNDQIDDVAFAGDLNGNLWRYDLSDPNPEKWQSHVTLAYKPEIQNTQPITVMPRLFPDPATNRFIVVFGTGNYVEASGNASDSAAIQSIYGIRDKIDSSGNFITAVRENLQKQTLHEATSADGSTVVRGVSDNSLSIEDGGWYIDLDLTNSPGERVVVTPEALFDTNRVIVTTLIPGDQRSLGALMVLNAATGGAAGGLSSSSGPAPFGTAHVGVKVVGGLVDNPPRSGSLPVATVIGGGKLLIPGLRMKGGGSLNIDSSIWRRRSWRELNNDQ